MRRSAWGCLGLLALAGLGCAGRGRIIERKEVWPRTAAFAPVAGGLEAAPAPVRGGPAGGARVLSITARRGDCLWTLARRKLGTGFRWPEIAKLNRLSSPWLIRRGRRILIPAGDPADAPSGPAGLAGSQVGGIAGPPRAAFRAVPNGAFTVGEKLTFAVQYGALTAGYATLSIPDVQQRHGRPVFHVVAEATSLPFFDLFFKVHDVLDSYIDVEGAFSWGYEKHLHEGGFKADAVYDYDQGRGLMLEPAKGKQAALPFAAQDVLSCFYYFRTQPLHVGSVVAVAVTADDMKSYELTVNVLRKERVSTLAGDFDCLVVQPHLAFQGVFRQKGEVFLWVTDDQRRLPVLIRSKIVIGSININLQNAQWVKPLRGASSGSR